MIQFLLQFEETSMAQAHFLSFNQTASRHITDSIPSAIRREELFLRFSASFPGTKILFVFFFFSHVSGSLRPQSVISTFSGTQVVTESWLRMMVPFPR